MDEPRPVSICVGIDVSKDRLDVHLRPSGESFAVARDGKGLENLVERLTARDVSLIVLEATGGFETTVAAALAGAALPLAVVNPRQIRDFARAQGQARQDRRHRCAGHRLVRGADQAASAAGRLARSPNAR